MSASEKNKVGVGVNMPRQTDFAIALHFHQPIGNFDKIFEQAYHRCYLKFLKLLQKYPQIKMSLHFSGSLLSWIEKNHPEFFNEVKKLIKSNQVEILTGGFYEPILPVISEEDAIGQIKMLTNYIKRRFKFTPVGVWIPERVWEPKLTSTLNKAGIRYGIIDDTHFAKAGLKKSQMHSYYITKDDSKTLALFASDRALRYRIPFRDPKQTLNYIKRASRNNQKAIFFYGDDVEKFGEWPGTYKHVYENKWLDRFFNMLIDNSSWLKTVTLQEAMDRHLPSGKIYVPSASYHEMLKWSGGCWRNFLIKYPESNQMHKKMMRISKRIKDLKRKMLEKGDRPRMQERTGLRLRSEPSLFSLATEYLYRGQSSCAYWHGLFGGLYLFNLRAAVYENLIKAEDILDRIEFKKANIQITDYKHDGFKEIVFSNRLISVYLNPNNGGSLLELDYKPLSTNLINTLSRKKESYHKQIRKEKIIYDSYQKYCFLDHVMPPQSTYQQFKAANLRETEDFINKSYSYKVKNIKDGKIIIMNAASKRIFIEKKIDLYDNISSIKAEYLIKNISKKLLNIVFGIEFNIIMPDGNPPIGLESYTQLTSISDFNVRDKKGNINLQFNVKPDSRVWTYPINTVSRSEKGYKYNYQGTTILFNRPLKLLPEDVKTFSINFEINGSRP